MYDEPDSLRELSSDDISNHEYRSCFRRDYARLIHSPAFRRLQGKTQLYPGLESDFFRNRLTHSLEVAQISKSIALKINDEFLADKPEHHINPDICEFAGLAHDLGHPPFGHQGEEALDECMRDFGGFEGNAQTLRLLSRIEKKCRKKDIVSGEEYRCGLNLTFRALASILKYDKVIPLLNEQREKSERNRAVKGYYLSEKPLVNKIKKNVLGKGNFRGKFKTVECQIMDIADDIAYSTYDLEDGFKAGFYHPTLFFSYPDTVFENVAHKVENAISRTTKREKPFSATDVQETLFEIFATSYEFNEQSFITANDEKGKEYFAVEKDKASAAFSNIVNQTTKASKSVAEDGYLRAQFTSDLVNSAIEGVRFKFNAEVPALSKVFLEESVQIKVEVLKNFTYESQILSPRLKVAEFRGKEIVKAIFDALASDKNQGWLLMPMDYQALYHHFNREEDKKRCVCDFVGGMTDKYAIEFYGRLKSENPETIFKPF